MNTVLKQSKLFISRDFELTDKSLKIKIVKPFNDTLQSEISLEEISLKSIRRKYPNIVPFIITVAMFVGVVVTIISHFTEKEGSGIFDIGFYLIALVISILLTYFTYQDNISIVLNHGGFLVFDYNKQQEIEIAEFLLLLRERQKAFLLNKYVGVNSGLSIQQLSSNLYWLWDTHFVEDSELEKIQNQLTNRDNPSIGFKLNTSSN